MTAAFSFPHVVRARRCIFGKRNHLLDLGELITYVFDKRFVTKFRRNIVDLRSDESDQRRLPKDFCVTFVVVLLHRSRHDLRAANPSAETHQDHEILILMRSHRSFDLVLCRFELFLQRIPIVIFGKLVNAAAAPKNVLADAECLRQFENVRSGVLDLLRVACLDRDETIGNEAARD